MRKKPLVFTIEFFSSSHINKKIYNCSEVDFPKSSIFVEFWYKNNPLQARHSETRFFPKYHCESKSCKPDHVLECNPSQFYCPVSQSRMSVCRVFRSSSLSFNLVSDFPFFSSTQFRKTEFVGLQSVSSLG